MSRLKSHLLGGSQCSGKPGWILQPIRIAISLAFAVLWSVLNPSHCHCQDHQPRRDAVDEDAVVGERALHQRLLSLFANDVALQKLTPLVDGQPSSDTAVILSVSEYRARAVRLTEAGPARHFDASVLSFKQFGAGSSASVQDAQYRQLWEGVKTLFASSQAGAARVPPEGLVNCLLVFLYRDKKWHSRVYDRWQLPAEVVELLRSLPDPGPFAPLVTSFRPQAVWKPPSALRGPTTVSPIDLLCVSVLESGGLVSFAAGGSEKPEYPQRLWKDSVVVTHCRFSPDGRKLAVVTRSQGGRSLQNCNLHLLCTTTWKPLTEVAIPDGIIQHCAFSPDSGFALLNINDRVKRPTPRPRGSSAEPRLNVRHGKLLRVDTAAGRVHAGYPGLPDGLAWCSLSAHNAYAVVWEADQSVSVWDCRNSRRVSTLAENAADVSNAVISPDGRKVALSLPVRAFGSSPPVSGSPRLSIWNTATGTLDCELRLYEVLDVPLDSEIIWTPDSRYLIARTRLNSIRDIYQTGSRIPLWDAESGRHIADFIQPTDTLAPSRVAAHGLTEGGRTILATSAHGVVHKWSLVALLGEREAQ